MKTHIIDGLPILLHNHDAPFTHFSIRVAAGSAHETANQYGLAHALEHMMFKGTPTRDQMQVDRDFERLGASHNAGTGTSGTFYWIDARNENWREAAKIVADLWLNATLPADEWAKEKDVILSEYRRMLDDPRRQFWGATTESVFGELLHHTLGTEQSVKSFTQEDLATFRRHWYGKPNVYVLAVGDVNEDDPSFVAELLADAPDAVTEETQVAREALKIVPLDPVTGSRWSSRPNLQEGRLLAFQQTVPFGSEFWVHEDVIMQMLGGGSSALLFERIRKELGMSCYGLYAYQISDATYNTRCIEAGIAPDQIERMEKEIQQILAEFPSRINEDRFEIARAQMLTQMARQEEGVSNYAGVLAFYRSLGAEDPILERQAFMEQLRTMDYDEIAEYAETAFVDKEWYWGHLIPE